MTRTQPNRLPDLARFQLLYTDLTVGEYLRRVHEREGWA